MTCSWHVDLLFVDKWKIVHQTGLTPYSLLPNEALAWLMDTNLRRVGGVTYSPEEQAFAEKLRTGIA